MDDGRAVGVAAEPLEACRSRRVGAVLRRRARAAIRRTRSRSTMPTKPLSIGMSTARRRRRDHPRRGGAGDQQLVRDGEVLDQARRDGAAAGLDAPGAVEQQHRAAGAGQVVGRGRAGRAAADHDRVEGLDCASAHAALPAVRRSAKAVTSMPMT